MGNTGNTAKHAAGAGSLGNVQKVLVAGGKVCRELRGRKSRTDLQQREPEGERLTSGMMNGALQSPGREITRSVATLQRAMKNS